MNDEQKAKQRSVDRRLAPCVVAATEGGVAEVRYTVDDRHREHVHVLYADGFERRVNVTWDSLAAIVRDVFREL